MSICSVDIKIDNIYNMKPVKCIQGKTNAWKQENALHFQADQIHTKGRKVNIESVH